MFDVVCITKVYTPTESKSFHHSCVKARDNDNIINTSCGAPIYSPYTRISGLPTVCLLYTMTSALAARKAALAAQALLAAAPQPTSKAVSPVRAVRSPSLPSSEDDIPGPSKRRKVTTTKKTARYFAPASDSDDEIQEIQVKRRNRKFSPSAPASEADDGMDDSSEEEVSSVGEEVDEGRAVWTAPTPARLAVKPTSAGSKFKPVSEVNVALVTDEELSKCGIAGEGAGMVISLGKQEVSLINL